MDLGSSAFIGYRESFSRECSVIARVALLIMAEYRQHYVYHLIVICSVLQFQIYLIVRRDYLLPIIVRNYGIFSIQHGNDFINYQFS